jgi:hypothetical protein
MPTTHYEITVRGRMSPALAEGFDGLSATTSGPNTVLRGEIADQSALYGVLDRVESLGLELIDVHRRP